MLPCICPVISQKTSKCGKNTLGYRLVSYHILTSSVIYYWTDARQHGIYLLMVIIFEFNLELICTSEISKKLKLHEPLYKYFAQKNCQKMFLEAIFFAFEKTFFRAFKMFVIALHDIIGLQNFSLSFCQSLSRITMCNLHWCYSFCTGVTLFALVLHLNRTALSQSESSNFFRCIIRELKKPGRDADDNVDSKMSLSFTYESCDTLTSFSFCFSVSKLLRNLTWDKAKHFELSRRGSRSTDNAEFGHFALLIESLSNNNDDGQDDA